MAVKFSNNAVTTLSASISAGATSFTVASASTFPTLGASDWTYVSLTSEVVKVTAISGTTFTCDATSDAHASGESVELRMTAELLNDFAEDTEAVPVTGGTFTGDLAIDGDTTLSAYNNTAAITGNAVDVFIYDTSNDSDGGAWRKRTQATSWYNETLNTSTRGSRKEFPSVAVIVADDANNKITIYDGDTPDLDMWMVQTSYTSAINAVEMLNGQLVIGDFPRMCLANFISEKVFYLENAYAYFSAQGDTVVSGTTLGTGISVDTSNSQRLVGQEVNDVAMTVLPNAPIDSTTGLPIPTIAVATNGGVSVIKDDGSVVDITGTDGNTACKAIWFDDNNEVWFKTSQHISIGGNTIPSSDFSNSYIYNFFRKRYFHTTAGGIPPVPAANQNNSSNFGIAKDTHIVGYNLGLNLLKQVDEAPETSSVAYITSTYNSGYMTGDIKGAWLSDTDTTNLGTELLTTTQSEFNTLADYTNSWSSTAAPTVTAGVLNFVEGNNGWGDTLISYGNFKKNTHYEIRMSAKLVFGSKMVIRARVLVNGAWVYRVSPDIVNTSFSEISFIFNTEDAVQNIGFGCWGGTALSSLDVEWFRLREADADRSVNNNGLQVNGTITKTAVATGADLVAYSGFSTSNYLKQPYNADLDFGTGDFSMTWWFKSGGDNGTYQWLLERQGGELEVFTFSGTGILRVYVGGNVIETGQSVFTGSWSQLCFVRRNGIGSLYLDGQLKSSTAMTGDMSTNNSSPLTVGARNDGTYPVTGHSLALLRISATTPTAAQIKEIYDAEKPLFQENAKCTLNGTSDAVQCLAYDDSTELLHVGTSGGRSTFQGLRRVDETATNTTEISAQGGMIIEETA